MKEKIKKLVSNRRVLTALFILFAVIASIQSLIGTKTYEKGGIIYNNYNNYTIFKNSFDHLRNYQDLYILYPQEQWDLYKYTPSFSVFFGIFSMFPDWLGLNLWNILNAIILLLAVYYLPKLSNYQKGLVLLISLIELMTSMQNEQSNGLIAGLIILSFGLMEKDKPFLATLCVVFSVFIKLFGIVGFIIFLFYPKKFRSALYAIFWAITLFLVPLFFINWEQYIKLFTSYLNLLSADHSSSYGYSVMGWLNSWFSVEVNKNMIVGLGILIFLLPLYRIKMYNNFAYKNLYVSSLLIWIVIFNHKAESPTFIIAMAGVALWFVSGKKELFNIILFISAFILTSLSPTDIFPRHLREEFLKPFVLKAVPCIMIWIKIIYDLVMLNDEKLTLQKQDPFLEQPPLAGATVN